MRNLTVLFMISLLLMAISGCTAGPNELTDTPDAEGVVAGFWRGTWHGLISPVALVISVFSDAVAPYETHNNGGWYNLGFLLGASIVFGGSGGAAKRRC
jgi:hypothetical protein